MASRPCLRELLSFSNLGPLNQIPGYSRTWVARGRNCRYFQAFLVVAGKSAETFLGCGKPIVRPKAGT